MALPEADAEWQELTIRLKESDPLQAHATRRDSEPSCGVALKAADYQRTSDYYDRKTHQRHHAAFNAERYIGKALEKRQFADLSQLGDHCHQ